MNMITILQEAIKHIGNCKYKEATQVLEFALEKLQTTQVVEEVKEKPYERLSKTDLINLSREEQIKLIKNWGGITIPKTEKDRVKLLLKLQG